MKSVNMTVEDIDIIIARYDRLRDQLTVGQGLKSAINTAIHAVLLAPQKQDKRDCRIMNIMTRFQSFGMSPEYVAVHTQLAIDRSIKIIDFDQDDGKYF